MWCSRRGVRGRGSGVGDRGSGVGDQGSGIGDQGSGIRGRGSGVGDRGSGVGDQGSGVGDQNDHVTASQSHKGNVKGHQLPTSTTLKKVVVCQPGGPHDHKTRAECPLDRGSGVGDVYPPRTPRTPRRDESLVHCTAMKAMISQACRSPNLPKDVVQRARALRRPSPRRLHGFAAAPTHEDFRGPGV
jgi:hypothetical protein